VERGDNVTAELAIAAEIAKEVGSVDKLLRNLMNIDFLFKDNLNKRRVRKVIEQLEYIYFSRGGVRRSLEMIRDKQIRSALQRDQLIGTTDQFYQDNPSTYETIKDLEDFFFSTELKHGNDFTDIGILITYVKTKVRDAIWELFNELDSNNFSETTIDAASTRAADILQTIETLNDAIRLGYQ
jgi:hypothetical protein